MLRVLKLTVIESGLEEWGNKWEFGSREGLRLPAFDLGISLYAVRNRGSSNRACQEQQTEQKLHDPLFLSNAAGKKGSGGGVGEEGKKGSEFK